MGCAACGQKYRKRNNMRFQKTVQNTPVQQPVIPTSPGAPAESESSQARVPGVSQQNPEGVSDVPAKS
jgi:hypothetical protein